MADTEKPDTEVQAAEQQPGEPAPAQPIEIEIAPDGEARQTAPAPEGEPAPEPQPDKPRQQPKVQKRIDRLTAELNGWRQRAEAEAEEKARIAAERDRAVAAYQHANTANFVNYEARIKTGLDQAKAKLAKAHAEGDPQAIADATAEVGRFSAEFGQIEQFKANRPQAPARPTAPVRQPVAEPPPAAPSPQVEAWVKANPWFDQDSDDYDPEMAEEARAYATIIEQQNPNNVGTKDYFAKIDRYMRAARPDHPHFKTPDRRPVSSVAGVSRMGNGALGAPPPSTRVTLTPDEQDMARRMGDVLRKPDGSKYSLQELYVMKARAKQEIAARDAATPRSS